MLNSHIKPTHLGFFDKRFLAISYPPKIQPDEVAIVMYGHLRGFKSALQKSISLLRKKFKIRVFIHTWNTLSPSSNEVLDYWAIHESLAELIKKDELIALRIDDQTKIDSIRTGMELMYSSLWLANNLKKEYENQVLCRFEQCLKLRPDIEIMKVPHVFANGANLFIQDQNLSRTDIIEWCTSRTLDRLVSFLSSNIILQQKEVVLDGYNRLQLSLGMQGHVLQYPSEWRIIY